MEPHLVEPLLVIGGGEPKIYAPTFGSNFFAGARAVDSMSRDERTPPPLPRVCP